jgi:moderate conductance mechanosensitive channel
MIAPKTFAVRRTACLLLGTLLAVASLSAIVWAETTRAAEPTVSVSELERLVQQIEDPQRRAELLNTLRALIAVATPGQAAAPPPKQPDLFSDQSQGLFFAFGELTQRLASIGRKVGREVAMLPVIFEDLPARLMEPATFWFVIYSGVSAVILVTLGIIFQLIARQLEARLRARTQASDLLPRWRRVWLALITIGLAAAPYVALLVISGVVFSILPIGAISSGLGALVISTVLLYRLFRAVAFVLLNPGVPSARLLPMGNSTAQRTWNWVVPLLTLGAAYFFITRSLLTIGVAEEFYQVVRGLMIIIVASVLSALIWHLSRAQRPALTPVSEDNRRLWSGVMTTMQKIWPLIAITYIWCAAFLALLSLHQRVTFMVAASLRTAVVIGAGIAVLWAGDLLYNRAAALNNRVGRYLSGLEMQTLRYLKAVRWGFRVLIILVGFLSILEVWGVGITWFLISPLGGDLLSRLITLLVTAAVVIFVMDLSAFISRKLIMPAQGGVEPSKKLKTLVPLTATVIKYGALFAGGLIALHQVGVNITPILAGVGVLGLAVGFGAQTLVKDIINGLFILVEDSISVGDVVNIRGTGGLVEAINLRTIRLRDLQGSVHVIPNSQVEIITNMTKDYSYYVLDVEVAYREDTDEVIAALQEIDAEMRADPALVADMLAPIEILGVERFTDSAVVVRARLKTKPSKQWSIGREFNRRLKKLFDARGIEIPFPHRTIYWGEPKRGKAPPLQLQLQNPGSVATTTDQGEGQAVTHQGGDTHAH